MAGSIRGGPLGGDTCRHLALDLECRTLGAGLEEREWGQSEGEAHSCFDDSDFRPMPCPVRRGR